MYDKKLVICFQWGKLETIKPIPWGYSLHLTPVHFTKFLKANQANKILRNSNINLLIEPIGKPFSCWVGKRTYHVLLDNFAVGQWGSLHIGKAPQKYEIYEDLDLINALFSEGEQFIKDFKEERLKESKIKLNKVIIEVDFIKKQRKKA